MKPLTEILIGLTALAALAAFCGAWLWFMIRRPVQWAALVGKENQFWVRTGLMSPVRAEKCRRFELATGRKLLLVLVVAALLECAGGFFFIAFMVIRSGVLFHH